VDYVAGAAPFGVRLNTVDPSELDSYLPGWLATWKAGEPYDRPDAHALVQAFRNKSAYYADDYLAAVAAGAARAVPVFAISGWTDTLFPATETLQMYRKLTAAVPSYPIYMALGDVGHATAIHRTMNFYYFNLQADQFLDAYARRGGAGAPARVISFVSRCPSLRSVVQWPDEGQPPFPPIAGTSWDGLRVGAVELSGVGSRITASGPSNAAEEAPTDPLQWGLGGFATNPCLTQAAGTYDSQADWTWPVDRDGGFTLLGNPTLAVAYRMTGTDATIAAKLWDVHEGTRKLVARGVYRLAGLGLNPSGTLEFQLFGNAWKFEEGHSVTLELSQTDAPFLRPDNLPSTIKFATPTLTLPTVEGWSDLQVTRIAVSNSKGPQGEKVTVTATIANTGVAVAGASKTEFLLDASVLGLVDTPAIPPGGTALVALNWRTAGVKSKHTITVTADRTGLVAEAKEDNNDASVTVVVKGNKA
jgi:hypothetical protein